MTDKEKRAMSGSTGAIEARNLEIVRRVNAGERRASIAERFRVHHSVVAAVCREHERQTGETLPTVKTRHESDKPHPPCPQCGAPVPRRDGEISSQWLARVLCGKAECWHAVRAAVGRASSGKSAERKAKMKEPDAAPTSLPADAFARYDRDPGDGGRVRLDSPPTLIPRAFS